LAEKFAGIWQTKERYLKNIMKSRQLLMIASAYRSTCYFYFHTKPLALSLGQGVESNRTTDYNVAHLTLLYEEEMENNQKVVCKYFDKNMEP
jgi:hypothetical protein